MNKSVEEYRAVVGDREVDEIEEISKHLSGIKIKHVNSTKFGGAVAEILKSCINYPPLGGVSPDSPAPSDASAAAASGCLSFGGRLRQLLR